MKILLAIDDNPRSMDEALRLARDRGASLTALFVLDTGWSVYTGSDFLLGSHARADFLDYTRDDELAQKQQALAAMEAKARDAGVDCTAKSAATWHVVEAVLAELEAGGYDLLVMSQPFRRGLEVMRDAAAQVLKKAPCDVLLVRRGQ
jgi:nucleotide-binding universal stress UspA family protein